MHHTIERLDQAVYKCIDQGMEMVERMRGHSAPISRTSTSRAGNYLAAGTSARVYEAEGRPSAVVKRYDAGDLEPKILARHVWTASDPALLKAGLVPVEEYWCEDDAFAIVTPRCDSTVADHLRTAGVGEIKRVLPQIAHQCSEAHKAGYILNDVLNPANILVRGGAVHWTDTENLFLMPGILHPEDEHLNTYYSKHLPKYVALRLIDNDCLPRQQDDIESLALVFADLAYRVFETETAYIASDKFCREGAKREGLGQFDELLRAALCGSYTDMHSFAADTAELLQEPNAWTDDRQTSTCKKDS